MCRRVVCPCHLVLSLPKGPARDRARHTPLPVETSPRGAAENPETEIIIADTPLPGHRKLGVRAIRIRKTEVHPPPKYYPFQFCRFRTPREALLCAAPHTVLSSSSSSSNPAWGFKILFFEKAVHREPARSFSFARRPNQALLARGDAEGKGALAPCAMPGRTGDDSGRVSWLLGDHGHSPT